MNSDDIGDIAIWVVVLYLVVAVMACYPAVVVGYYFDHNHGTDAGYYAFMISIGVLIFLGWIRQFWLLLIIYLLALVPFILICIKWYKECSAG